MRIAIVGSGMSALGASMAAFERGWRVDVFDVGRTIPESTKSEKNRRRGIEVSSWTKSERVWPRSFSRFGFLPDKTKFGTGFFLSSRFRVEGRGRRYAPASEAGGGMASSWGGSALPLSSNELSRWTEPGASLAESFEKVLRYLPYSFSSDDLSGLYGDYGKLPDDFSPSRGSELFLERLRSAAKNSGKDGVHAGRARLLIETGPSGCRRCGLCNSGCVFDAILNPYHLLMSFVQKSGGKYLSDFRVERVSEDDNGAEIHGAASNRETSNGPYDAIFLATGPFALLEILQNSQGLQGLFTVEARAGFVFPAFDFKDTASNHLTFPEGSMSLNGTTLPAAFVEMEHFLGKHHIHTQISYKNELLPLGPSPERKNRAWILFHSRIWSKVRFFGVNFTGDLGSNYTVSCNGDPGTSIKISYKRSPIGVIRKVSLFFQLGLLAARAGVLAMPLFLGNNASYHVGAVKRDGLANLTGPSGELTGLSKVRVVDTSSFPFLPASTTGLTACANAFRIVSDFQQEPKTSSA